MLSVIQWGRQIMFLFGRPAKRHYTAEQVQSFLSGKPGAPDDPEIRQMIERLPTILANPAVRRQYEGFQRYVEVLPRILFLYHRGVPPAVISSKLSFLATSTGVETVVWITSRVVAEHLNRSA